MREILFGAAILGVALAFGGEHLAWADQPLLNDLQKLDQMRKGKNTPFDEVERQGKKLLAEHTSPEEQGHIFYHLAELHGQSGMVHPELVVEYAQRALQFPLEPKQRLRLYTYWGDALMIGNLHAANQDKKPFPEIRKLAAVPYLEGLKDAQKYRIPDQRPTMPLGLLYDMPESDSHYQQVKKEAEERAAAQQRTRIEQDLWDGRRILTGQIVGIYSRKPFATEELRELTIKTTGNSELASRLVAMVDRKIKGIKEPDIRSQNGRKEKD
jgi:hypothetical protein